MDMAESPVGLEQNRAFHKAKELRNSTNLRKFKSANYPEVTSLVDHLFDEMVAVLNLTLTRGQSIKKLKHHIEFFVLNLYKAHRNDPTKVIAYHRSRNAYSGRKSKYKNKFGLSYRYSVDNGKDGKPVMGFLEKQGYIVNFPGYRDKNNPENSYQSRMRATQKLINLIADHYRVTEAMVEYDYSDDELVVMKGVKPKPKLIPIVKNGKRTWKKIQPERKIVKTPNTPAVREIRKNLEIINSVMEKAEITLDITDKELAELNARMLNDPDPYKQAIDFSRKRLHRVFLDRRLDRGGRFYGPWYQNIPKEYRPRIMIDGAPTLELDYSSLHPNLLYHFAGVDPPEGDLYTLDDYSKSSRKFIKAVFLKMLNAETREATKGSMREDVFVKKKLKAPLEMGNLADKYLDPVIDKLLDKHKPLEGFIFKDKDLGIKLQNIDSKIAEKVLLYFALERNMPVLPMHDSFRIDARVFQELEEIMQKVIITNFGRPIRISNDDFMPLFSRMFDMWEEKIRNGEYLGREAELDSLFDDIEASNIFNEKVAKLRKLQRKKMKSKSKYSLPR